MSQERSNPDEIIREIKTQKSKSARGHLKIFFGYAAGVGKTYAMLKAAHTAKKRGIDVVVGYIEPHARPKTMQLLDGLEILRTKEVDYNGIKLKEFDLDSALECKPQLILVDEFAHTNAAGSRHTKRYQDIEELLKNGINVYTTVNVQHIESLNDTVASITGITVRDRIPDSTFDSADQVELIDIEPEELIERLNYGKIYRESQVKNSIENFFTIENLTALKEIALRRCADRVNLLTETARQRAGADYHTDEHILVCLSSSPSNAKNIRTAARMASAFRGIFTALFVETPDYALMSEENKKRLRNNIRLAEQLGARIETVYGDDVPFQIAEFARLSGVSKIVLGRSAAKKHFMFGKPSLTEKLTSTAPNLDIYIIPDSSSAGVNYSNPKKSSKHLVISVGDTIKTILILIAASCVGMLFECLGFTDANIITVFILGVLLISIFTQNQIYGLLASAISVLVFNFLFTEPRFSFRAYDSVYPITFAVMFIAAFVTGSLAIRLKKNAKQSAQAAFRTKVLLNTTHLLQQAKDKDEIISITAGQLIKLLNKSIVIYPVDKGKLFDAHIFPADENPIPEETLNENERSVAMWVMKNNKHAGAATDTLSASKCLYLSIRVNDVVYGVVGVVVGETPIESFEKSIMLSILSECAISLENDKNAREKEAAAVLAENERLRANLLRSISHDLRTPLTSISGNAGNLMHNGEKLSEETKNEMYANIYDDSMWLINLVENLLAVTRLIEGRVQLKMTSELIDNVIEEALKHINRNSVEHNITVKNHDELLLARMDARLIVQVIINLIDNAIKYTPEGSDILIEAFQNNDKAVVQVSDNGNGIPDEMKPHIFEMFYSGANTAADSRRSLGLGLSLCKSIINAHNGIITVSDNVPQGSVFTFTLNIAEVDLNEQTDNSCG